MMKNKNKFLASKLGLLIVLMLLTLVGCEKQVINLDNVSNDVKVDAVAYYGKVITVNDFPKEKILSNIYVNGLNNSIQTGDVGYDSGNAIVPLIFDINGVLYTAKRFENELLNNDKVGESMLHTDLKTFKEVTGLLQATNGYTKPMPNDKGDAIWTFDPYVKFFDKIDALVSVSNVAKARVSSNVWNQVGNIIYARWDGGGVADKVGHTGGISWTSVSSNNRATIMKNTKIIEASNRGNSLAGVTIGTKNGVFERYMTNITGTSEWNSNLVYLRTAMWYPPMTATQRSQIAKYMNDQLGEPYNFNSSKSDESQWYCSKLQWMAYKKVLGIDIDRDGGVVVFPSDIQYSPLLVGVSF